MNPQEIYRQLPVIETERLLLRKMMMKDAEDLFEYASQPEVSSYLPWQVHQSIGDSKAFLNFILEGYNQHSKLTWAIELKSSGKMIGTIDFVSWSPKRHKAEIAYVLSPHYWGHGLMAEAAAALLSFGFRDMELNKVEAPIMSENKQSQRLAEKLGMIREGVARQHMIIKGEFVDLAMYAVLKSEFILTE
ncbi:GNAT family N-acetyltransferase [Planococcus donghaensis]|uniref:GNAT family N-acetyltransferase n=1 Tax=Planococcus donghaensis TaxID=414778 RepID=UPI00373628D3